jgi:N utilization substance protein B
MRRAAARKIALQALYGWQLNPAPWQDLFAETLEHENAAAADRDYLQALLQGICTAIDTLDADIAAWGDAPPGGIDPVERAALLIGLHELRNQPEVPFKVAISEAVGLARRFGATDGHNFVNAVLDRAARELRPHER